MNYRKMVVFGGVSFITAALAFVFVFAYLATNFSYPSILDGSAAEVLPRLRSGGSTMRSIWAVYAMLPLLLIPGALGAYFSCPLSRARMTLALVAASLGSLAMCLGLMRWPSIHWALAEAYAGGGAESRNAIDAVFNGLNLYLGNYVGEFLGETMLASFFLLCGLSLLDEKRFPNWLGWASIVFSFLFLLGAFRNVASQVQVISDINNGLLPLWLIVLGIATCWYSRRSDDEPNP